MMAYRNGNYSAFYVDSPFDENNLGAHATKDLVIIYLTLQRQVYNHQELEAWQARTGP